MRRVLGVLLLAGCGPIPGEEADLGTEEQALFGQFSVANSCNASERNLLTAAHDRARESVASPEFEACMTQWIYDRDPDCGGSDLFADRTAAYRWLAAWTVSSGLNVNDLRVTECGAVPALAVSSVGAIYEWGHDRTEEVRFNRLRLDEYLVGGTSERDLALVAGFLWEPAVASHGYSQWACVAPDGTNRNTIPRVAAQCVEAGVLSNRVIANAGQDDTTTGVTLLPGRHRASAGHFGAVGNDNIERFVLGPGTRLRYCTDEGGGVGAGTCRTVDNPWTISQAHWIPAAERNRTSLVDVTPLAVSHHEPKHGYRAANGMIHRRALGPGRYRASLNQLGPDDGIDGFLVSAGARVRACADEGGGAGAGACETLDDTDDRIGLVGQVSFVEVTPVVSLFSNSNLFGVRKSFAPGRFRASQGQFRPLFDDAAESVVVPQGLQVRLCTSEGNGSGGGTCLTTTRSLATLPALLANQVSFVEVTAL